MKDEQKQNQITDRERLSRNLMQWADVTALCFRRAGDTDSGD